MNKKATAISEADYLVFNLVITSLVLILFVSSFASILGIIRYANEGPIPLVEQRIIELRVLNSEECFSYSDQRRVYSGTFDKDKINQQVMRNCLPLRNTFGYGVQLEINYVDSNNNQIKEILRTQNVETGITGSFVRVTRTYPILIKDGGFGTITFTHIN